MTERRMEAYYYEFGATGVDAVDKVLSAVACAGKAFHNTAAWCEHTAPYDDHTGACPVEWIQNAAIEAANEIDRLRFENAQLSREHATALRVAEVAADRMRAWQAAVYLVDPLPLFQAVPNTTFDDPVPPIPEWRPDRLTNLLDRLARMRAALARAASVFDKYADMHEANGTTEGKEKARVNREEACRAREAADQPLTS